MNADRRILVALDGSDRDEELIRYANVVARLGRRAARFDAEGEGGKASREFGPPMTDSRPPRVPATPVVIGHGPAVVVTAPSGLRFVRAADYLRGAEACEDVILAGEGEGALAGRRLARHLVRGSASSVWFVPDGPPRAIRRILVPVDFSTRSADSLRVATTLASLSGAAECIALHVSFNACIIDTPGEDRRARERLAGEYARFMAGIDTLTVPVSPRFREALDVGRAVARVAEEEGADLIVMASRGRTAVGALLMESVAEKALGETRLPLLVVKHFGARLGLLRTLFEKVFRRGDEVRFG